MFNPERSQVSEQNSQNEAHEPKENLIEKEPLSPIVAKYEQKIEEQFAKAREIDVKVKELKETGKFEEAAKMDSSSQEIRAGIFSGGGPKDTFIELPKKSLSSMDDYDKRVYAVRKEFRDAMHDSPQMILRMAEESGNLSKFGSLEGISPRLLNDKKFIEALAKTGAAKNDPKFQVALRDNLFGKYAANQVMR